MSLTTILTQFALTVGASLAERIASALSARIKQEPEPEASPVDIAIATKSAVSADREGKIASERAKAFLVGEKVQVNWAWQKSWTGTVVEEVPGKGYKVCADRGGGTWVCNASEMKRIATKSAVSADREGKLARERGRCGHPLVKQWQTNTGLVAVSCPKCGTMSAAATLDEAKKAVLGNPRRLGDYGPSGGG